LHNTPKKPFTLESCRVVDVSADLEIDFNKAAHDDLNHLPSGQSILQSISQDEGDWKTLPEFVGSCRRTGGLKKNNELAA